MSIVADIIRRLGGQTKVSRSLGVPGSTVASWSLRNSVPDKHKPRLISLGRETGVALTADDFLPVLPETPPAEAAE